MVKGFGSKREENVLVEEVRHKLQVVAEGHKTLDQKMDRVAAEVKGGIGDLDRKIDRVAQTLIQRMDEGFGHMAAAMGDVSKQLQEHTHPN